MVWVSCARPIVSDSVGDAQRGAQLAGLAGCLACHTTPEGDPYAGGHAIESPLGTFYGSNITSHRDAGIGSWTESDFFMAMRRGRSPEGTHYYPAFPYGSYTNMTDVDLRDLWAHLQSIPPSSQPSKPHDLQQFRWRGSVALWKLMSLNVGPAPMLRGRYLVDAVTHCPECHTPRSAIGVLRNDQPYAGSPSGPSLQGLSAGEDGWTEADWSRFLLLGMKPDGEFVGGEMARIIEQGTATLSDADRRDMARWLIQKTEL